MSFDLGSPELVLILHNILYPDLYFTAAVVLLMTFQPGAVSLCLMWGCGSFLLGLAGRWLCLTHPFLHQTLAVGDRGLGLQSLPLICLSVCLFKAEFIYSDWLGQTSSSAPEEVAEAGK